MHHAYARASSRAWACARHAQVYELAEYPFDVQGFTIALNFNCRSNGPLPTEIVIDHEQCALTMTCINLCPPNRDFVVQPELHVRPHDVGEGDRSFPACSFTAKANREPFYYIIYLLVPWGLLSFLSLLTIGARRPEDQNHRAQLALMLVLTAFTYRVATSGRLPPINYLTVLDYYTIPNALIVIFAAVEARIISFFVDPKLADDPPPMFIAARYIDACFVLGTGLFWFVLNTWFALLAAARSKAPKTEDENLCASTIVYDQNTRQKRHAQAKQLAQKRHGLPEKTGATRAALI